MKKLFGKSRKLRTPSSQPVSSASSVNIATGAPSIGTNADQNIGLGGSDNERASRIDLRESDIGQRPHAPDFSAKITGHDNDVTRAHESEPEQGVSVDIPSNRPTQGTPELSSAARAELAVQDPREPEDQGTIAEGPPQASADDVSEGSPISEDAHTGVQSGEENNRTIRDAAAPIHETTEGFGSLISVLSIISSNYKEVTAIRNKAEYLLPSIHALENHFSSPPGDVREQTRQTTVIGKLKVTEGHLWSLPEKPRPKQPTNSTQGFGEIYKLLEDVQEIVVDYQTVQQEIYGKRWREIDQVKVTILNNFPTAKRAEHCHGNRKGCPKGTCGPILDEVGLWARDFDGLPVYWLNGLARTGKSMIAQTVAERLFADGRLGASFFCSRDFEDRSNLELIFPTLAVQLARNYPEFRSAFIPLVQSNPEVAHECLSNQMKKLIVQPLQEFGKPTVIVVDALDECKDDEPASAILSVLGQLVAEIPKVKFFLTGRPESRIQNGFDLPPLKGLTDVFVLRDVRPSHVFSVSSHPDTHFTMVQSGKVYILTDRQSYGTLDLSGQDQKSVIGYPRHKGGNQRWKFEEYPDGWTIQCIHAGKYLDVEGSGRGAKVIAIYTHSPKKWDLQLTFNGLCIDHPGENLRVELDNTQGSLPPVVLSTKSEQALSQVWMFEEDGVGPSLVFSIPSHPGTHPTMVQSGKVYVLTDRQSYGTLDLSGQDQKSIIGYPRHKGGNQKWKFEEYPDGWTIQCIHVGKYLDVEGSGNGAKVIAINTPNPKKWDLHFTFNGLHIDHPGENLRVELDNTQGSLPPVVLSTKSEQALSQVWMFEEVTSQ